MLIIINFGYNQAIKLDNLLPHFISPFSKGSTAKRGGIRNNSLN